MKRTDDRYCDRVSPARRPWSRVAGLWRPISDRSPAPGRSREGGSASNQATDRPGARDYRPQPCFFLSGSFPMSFHLTAIAPTSPCLITLPPPHGVGKAVGAGVVMLPAADSC